MDRLLLQSALEQILGSENVYFQPPANVQLVYPCIVYQRDNMHTEFADNVPYGAVQRYQVTYIDRNPDSNIPKQLAQFPRCTYARFFVADNLNHDVFRLYF